MIKDHRFEVGGRTYKVKSMRIGQDTWIHVNGETHLVQEQKSSQIRRKKSGVTGSGVILAPMPGKILKVNHKAGDLVKAKQVLLIMEAMKMEYSITAPADGKIQSVSVSDGQQVSLQQELVNMVFEGTKS